mmetsp:Transcript_18539/g.70128  ORF Transcript_18539/g.70128 Transcript_18539/m.70128 type:complete len:397 (+) Transcript_18539:233-1423(+)
MRPSPCSPLSAHRAVSIIYGSAGTCLCALKPALLCCLILKSGDIDFGVEKVGDVFRKGLWDLDDRHHRIGLEAHSSRLQHGRYVQGCSAGELGIRGGAPRLESPHPAESRRKLIDSLRLERLNVLFHLWVDLSKGLGKYYLFAMLHDGIPVCALSANASVQAVLLVFLSVLKLHAIVLADAHGIRNDIRSASARGSGHRIHHFRRSEDRVRQQLRFFDRFSAHEGGGLETAFRGHIHLLDHRDRRRRRVVHDREILFDGDAKVGCVRNVGGGGHSGGGCRGGRGQERSAFARLLLFRDLHNCAGRGLCGRDGDRSTLRRHGIALRVSPCDEGLLRWVLHDLIVHDLTLRGLPLKGLLLEDFPREGALLVRVGGIFGRGQVSISRSQRDHVRVPPQR